MRDLWKFRDFKCMLLEEVNEPFDSDDYLYEVLGVFVLQIILVFL